MRGVHPKIVQELLGHSSISITLNTYSPVLAGMGQVAPQAMDEKLGTREAQCSSVEHNSLRSCWPAKSIWTGLHVTNPVLSCCSTMCRAIARIGSSRKKGGRYATERDEFQRASLAGDGSCRSGT